MYIVIGILAGIIILQFIIMWKYQRQVKDICRQLAFMMKYDSNMLINHEFDVGGIGKLSDKLNELLELRRKEKQHYQEKEALIADTYTNLSHDIRTPLTSLDGYFQLMEECENIEDQKRYLSIIHERIHSLNEMLEELFMFTKLKNESYSLELTLCCMNRILKETVFSYYDEWVRMEIQPDIQITEEQLYIHGNRQGLRRVIQNVIKNNAGRENFMKIIMLGAPGAGKGTQAKKIAEKYDIPHISTGDIFRANIKNGTELGQKAKTYMDQGLLVPDELVVDLVVDRVNQEDCSKGYVLDGFPRTIPQAEALDKALAAMGQKMDYAINVEVPDKNIVNRMSGRRACVDCGATYHIVYAPTEKEDVCDKCGGSLILRDDDKPETVLKRLGVYHEQTQPLIDYYTKAGILKEVDGTIDINDVFAAIVQILGE